jgi:uncharacterized protein with HEPN domain
MPRDATYLLHLLISARRIVTYARGLDWEDFMENGEKQDSILHRLTNIGEISKRISTEFKSAHPEVPWKVMAGMQDRIIHDYYQIDWEWSTATKSIPDLIRLIQPLVPPEE